VFCRYALVACLLILSGSPARAEPQALGPDALKQALSGKTVFLDTPFGVAVPITYHGNGLMSGKAGLLSYFLGAENDRGRWWVLEGKLCQRWFKWLDAEPSCMRLTFDGNKIAWRRDDGLAGTATIASALPPGAETGPRALGGPATAPEQGSSPAAAGPQSVRSRAIHAAPVSVSHDPRPQVRKTVTGLVPSRQSAYATDLAMNENWCRRDTLASDGSTPGLMLVTRSAHAAVNEGLPASSACLADQAALWQAVKQ
jgi:hypothetical protein